MLAPLECLHDQQSGSMECCIDVYSGSWATIGMRQTSSFHEAYLALLIASCTDLVPPPQGIMQGMLLPRTVPGKSHLGLCQGSNAEILLWVGPKMHGTHLRPMQQPTARQT